MTELLPVATPRRTRAALRGLLRPHRRLAAVALAGLTAATTVSLLTAPLLGRVVDLVANRAPVDALTTPVLLLLAVAAGQAGLAVVGVGATARLGERMLADLREEFVAHAVALPLERIERGGSGDLTSRVTEDVAVVGRAIREAFPEFAQAALMIALTLVGLTALDWRFGAAALLAVPVQAGTARWYVRRSTPLYAQQRVAAGAEQQQLLDTVGGARTVRAFRLADHHLGRVGERADTSVGLAVQVVRLHTYFFGRLNLAEAIGLSAVLVAGFLLVGAGEVSIGTASAAALYFANLFGPINTALFLLDTAQSATAGLARLVGVVDLPAEPVAGTPAPRPAGALAARDLHHAYVEGHPVLHGVDLDVPAGHRVALVGASGAGKTTLGKLVAGIHRPARGTVHVGGVDLAGQGSAAVRATVALVTQEVHVFAGPLAEDLRLAAPDATDGALRDALAAVGALDWALALPDGLATVVGSGGHELTVVQAQQLALARLVLADPPVAILDEATAEAGSAGARALDAAAAAAVAGRTAITIAHRLTQAASADAVVVLDGGRVVERGTHDELLAAGGVYAGLWAAWSDQR